MLVALLKLVIFALQSFYHLALAVIAVKDRVILINIIIAPGQLRIFFRYSCMFFPQLLALIIQFLVLQSQFLGLFAVGFPQGLFFLLL